MLRRPEQQQARVRRQPELGPERVQALASRQEPVLELALQQEQALARARLAVVGPLLVGLWLSWLEERVSRPATCRAVRVES
jgi:hypothetical protein